jgi:hypothetical protein
MLKLALLQIVMISLLLYLSILLIFILKSSFCIWSIFLIASALLTTSEVKLLEYKNCIVLIFGCLIAYLNSSFLPDISRVQAFDFIY